MKKIVLLLMVLAIFIFSGCDRQPKDSVDTDDLAHCGFGEEYVNGYYNERSGKYVESYCRKNNSR